MLQPSCAGGVEHEHEPLSGDRGHRAVEPGDGDHVAFLPEPLEGRRGIRVHAGEPPVHVHRSQEGVDQRGGMLECGAVLEPVLHRPAVPVHHVEQPFDVGRANEHVGIDALPRDPFHPGVGRRRVTWLDLEQAVVDRRPLDVQEVDAVVVRKNLEGRVGEADAHRPGHRVRVHDTTVSGRYSPSGGDNG